eukprot:5307277-Amphidinium_carterae.1
MTFNHTNGLLYKCFRDHSAIANQQEHDWRKKIFNIPRSCHAKSFLLLFGFRWPSLSYKPLNSPVDRTACSGLCAQTTLDFWGVTCCSSGGCTHFSPGTVGFCCCLKSSQALRLTSKPKRFHNPDRCSQGKTSLAAMPPN